MSQMKAFPNPTLADTQNNSAERLNDPSEYGMDLRDWFAAKAMQGFMSNPNAEELTLPDLAVFSYRVADAMMEARCTDH